MNKFTIPIELCDLNTYVYAERTNRLIAAGIKKRMNAQIAYFCKKLELRDCQHDVEIIWTTPDRRKDSDNIFFGVKFILDALIKAGKLKGDGYRYIRNISHKREIGTQKIEVTFIEVAND